MLTIFDEAQTALAVDGTEVMWRSCSTSLCPSCTDVGTWRMLFFRDFRMNFSEKATCRTLPGVRGHRVEVRR